MVQEQLAQWRKALRSEPLDPSQLRTSSGDKLIEVRAGRKGTVAEFFEPLLDHQAIQSLHLVNTWLAGGSAMNGFMDLLGCVVGAESGCKVNVTTNEPEPGGRGLPDTPTQFKARLQQIIGEKNLQSGEITFKHKTQIHDRYLDVTFENGTKSRIYMGRGIDFVDSNGLTKNTYLLYHPLQD